MIRRPPRSTLDRSSAASDVYKRQDIMSMQKIRQVSKSQVIDQGSIDDDDLPHQPRLKNFVDSAVSRDAAVTTLQGLSLIHISEPTRPY